MNEPHTVADLSREYLSFIAGRLLGGETVEVTSFQVVPDPFEFPRFGEKQFFELPFDYRSRRGEGRSAVILRVLPKMDAVMMVTGDEQHRELKAFSSGLLARVPKTFHVPYVHVIDDDSRGQHWAFLEDVRPAVAALGMHAELADSKLRTILSHLAAFHAEFWQETRLLETPWLMRLEQPVDYFYRCIVDILDGMKSPAASSTYMAEKWPWLAEGVVNLMESLDPDTRRSIETIYREPHRLLEKITMLPRTLCHYDFDTRNLGMDEGPDGTRTVVIDWEIVGEGLSSADVVRFLNYQQPPNVDELTVFYLDELERHLGRPVDRDEWLYGADLVAVALWQIVGVLFGVMVSAPSAPIPDEQRPAMAERAKSDIAAIEALVRKYGLS